MAVKTFSQGEVLTAADTNTYLNNGGLVFVKQVNVGTAVSTIDVTSCFSSTYDNYRIVYSNINPNSSSQDLEFRLLTGTTPANNVYNRGFIYVVLATNAVVGVGALNTTGINCSSVTVSAARHAGFIDVLMPNLAQYTGIVASNYFMRGDLAAMGVSGQHANQTAYDGFRLVPSSGNVSGGTVTVYGYRLG